MLLYIKILSCLLFLLYIHTFAENSYYSSINQNLYISPAFAAQGEAAIALSDEPLPMVNPAGINKAQRSTIFVGHSGYYKNLFTATTGYATVKIDTIQSFAASFSFLMIPDIDSVTQIPTADSSEATYKITPVTSSEMLVDLRYARSIFSRGVFDIDVGASLNFMRRRLINWTGYGIGINIGVLATINTRHALSLQLNNLTTQYTHWSDNYHENGLPQLLFAYGFSHNVRQGLRISVSYKTPDLLGNTGVAGGSFTTDGQFDTELTQASIRKHPEQLFTAAGYGLEFFIKNAAALRFGLTDTRKFTFGGGAYLFDRINVDFVYAHSSALEGSYGVSVRVAFGEE